MVDLKLLMTSWAFNVSGLWFQNIDFFPCTCSLLQRDSVVKLQYIKIFNTLKEIP